MNKTDRLLAIILELQGKGRQRAEDLATTFETSKRTIYRDIVALQASRVPIEGAAGIGYVLRSGFDLPPLMFTAAGTMPRATTENISAAFRFPPISTCNPPQSRRGVFSKLTRSWTGAEMRVSGSSKDVCLMKRCTAPISWCE